MLDATAFGLLRELEQNNKRERFQENQARFSAQVREPFADVLQAVCEALISADLPMWGGAHTMFRINRDVRLPVIIFIANPAVRLEAAVYIFRHRMY